MQSGFVFCFEIALLLNDASDWSAIFIALVRENLCFSDHCVLYRVVFSRKNCKNDLFSLWSQVIQTLEDFCNLVLQKFTRGMQGWQWAFKSRAPNEYIVQNHLNIALFNLF